MLHQWQFFNKSSQVKLKCVLTRGYSRDLESLCNTLLLPPIMSEQPPCSPLPKPPWYPGTPPTRRTEGHKPTTRIQVKLMQCFHPMQNKPEFHNVWEKTPKNPSEFHAVQTAGSCLLEETPLFTAALRFPNSISLIRYKEYS